MLQDDWHSQGSDLQGEMHILRIFEASWRTPRAPKAVDRNNIKIIIKKTIKD